MRERILIIEDDPDISESLRYNLQRNGFKTDIAVTGEEGLRRALGSKTLPSLILLDLMLPGMSGHEICRRLRSEPSTQNVPIVVLSAKASNADRVAGLDLGVDDYITKPFSVKEVITRIRSILRPSDGPADRTNDVDIAVDPRHKEA